MSAHEPQPESTAPIDEELVGYLDGELSPDECRRVEERLAADADYRQQLQQLDQAWEALDALPDTAAGDDFARTTIEMVALAARAEQAQQRAQFEADNRRRWRLWAAAGIAAALASFAVTRWLLPDANDRLVGDLPVVTQMDLLTQIRDVDFLRRLSQEIPSDGLVADEAAVERRVEQLEAAAAPLPAERRAWIEALSSDQRANLAAQAKQFDALPPQERDALRQLEHEIAAAADASELRHTLVAYGQWLARRNSGEKSDLRKMTTDERLRSIRDAVARDDEQAARRLSAEDMQKLRQEILEIYEERKDEFANWRRRRDRGDRPPLVGPPDAMALIVAHWALRNNDIDDRTRKRIVAELSEGARQHLERLAGRWGERGVKQQLWHWMHDAMMPRPKREAGDLERFFAEKLDTNQRERLLSLPRDQMEAELEQLYIGSSFGLQGVEWLGGPGTPGRGPGPEGPNQPGWRPEGPPPFGGPGDRRFERDGRRPRPESRRGPDDRNGPEDRPARRADRPQDGPPDDFPPPPPESRE